MPTDNQPSLDSSAFCFEAGKFALPKPDGEKKQRTFTGVAYSGDVITGHWYWDKVIFDLATMNVPTPLGALLDHEPTQRVGVVNDFSISNETGLSVSGVLLSNPDGSRVAADSDEGYPWQMSVRIDPSSIEEVQTGSIEVNGKVHQAPITVFRGGKILEVSFCALGADDKTHAVAASHQPNKFKSNSEETDMDLAAAQARITELETEAKTKDQTINDLQTQNKQFAADKRKAEIAALGKDLGKEFSADDVKDMLDLDDKAFAFTAKNAREMHQQFSAGKQRKLPDALFTEQATGGNQFSTDKTSLAEKAKNH